MKKTAVALAAILLAGCSTVKHTPYVRDPAAYRPSQQYQGAYGGCCYSFDGGGQGFVSSYRNGRLQMVPLSKFRHGYRHNTGDFSAFKRY